MNFFTYIYTNFFTPKNYFIATDEITWNFMCCFYNKNHYPKKTHSRIRSLKKYLKSSKFGTSLLSRWYLTNRNIDAFTNSEIDTIIVLLQKSNKKAWSKTKSEKINLDTYFQILTETLDALSNFNLTDHYTETDSRVRYSLARAFELIKPNTKYAYKAPCLKNLLKNMRFDYKWKRMRLNTPEISDYFNEIKDELINDLADKTRDIDPNYSIQDLRAELRKRTVNNIEDATDRKYPQIFSHHIANYLY